jgi:hypothetical protein
MIELRETKSASISFCTEFVTGSLLWLFKPIFQLELLFIKLCKLQTHECADLHERKCSRWNSDYLVAAMNFVQRVILLLISLKLVWKGERWQFEYSGNVRVCRMGVRGCESIRRGAKLLKRVNEVQIDMPFSSLSQPKSSVAFLPTATLTHYVNIKL